MSPSLPKTYKALVVKEAGKPLELIDVDMKKPGKGELLTKVIACGVCGSDAGLQAGHMGPLFPRVPGHEIVGEVVEVGEGVERFKVGDRVGGAWHGGHDGTCKACQKGLFLCCDNKTVNGVMRDGGYAEYVLLRAEATAHVPTDMDPAEVAPLLCAGVTVFNSIRKMHVEQGALVAVIGLGGLGHLAVQYASKMGYRVVALSSGTEKKDFAKQLGAHEYIDSKNDDQVKILKEMGGADLVVATAPVPKLISPMTGALAPGGKILVLAVGPPVEFNVVDLVTQAGSVHGWPSGHAIDSEEAIEFAKVHGVKCMVERFPLDKGNEAMQHMNDGKVRFRGVLMM